MNLKMKMRENIKSDDFFKVQILKSDKNVWNWEGKKSTFIFWLCGIFIILLILFFMIFAFTPLKKLMPGYPSEKERRESIENSIKLDSLDKEISLWKQQLHNNQLITSGREPISIKSDSAYIELIDAANAQLWEESEEQLREEVENLKKNE